MDRRSHRAARSVALIVLLFAAGSSTASAQAIHKCRDADGRLAYQDQPCGDAETLPAPVIAPAPAFVPPPDLPPSANPASPATEVPDAPPVSTPPMTRQFVCSTFDGKTYVSTNGNPPPRQVPLAALNFSKPYEVGDIMRAREGTLHPIPRTDAYTTVQDRCRPMGPREACGYYKQQYDDTSKQRRLAFNDTRPALEAKERELRAVLAAHCGR